jgi:hypothetical protein
MMGDIKQINVVKIGGNVIDNADALERFVSDFAKLPAPKMLIHGGGKLATRLSEKLEIPTQMIDGRRVTDRDTLDVVTMVYAGLLNKQIVAKLQAAGCNAIGLSGADANVIPAVRRSPVPVDFGFVGDIDAEKINTDFPSVSKYLADENYRLNVQKQLGYGICSSVLGGGIIGVTSVVIGAVGSTCRGNRTTVGAFFLPITSGYPDSRGTAVIASPYCIKSNGGVIRVTTASGIGCTRGRT